MRPLPWHLAILLAAFALNISDGHAVPSVMVEPVTLLENGEIAGCGFVSSATVDGAAAIGEVIAFREGDVTAFAVRARPGGNTAPITTVRLTTASHDTAKLFPPATSLPHGAVETRAVLEGFTGSSFAQELMVMGGRFEVIATDGKTITYDLPRPMPHGIRQAYLNCAGDLFRPVD